jgi:hypothetical protein
VDSPHEEQENFKPPWRLTENRKTKTPDQPLARSITTVGRGILTQIKSGVLNVY